MAQDEKADEATDEELRTTFQRSVDEGKARLDRTWLDLFSTGVLGGMDVSFGILGLLIVEQATGSGVLGAMAFAIGFIALTLGKSELFTENFLVPVGAVVARQATVASLLRLWIGTLVFNLVGGWLFAWLLAIGLPRLNETAVQVGAVYPAMDFPRAMSLGVLAGIAITLMTWMEHVAKSEFGKIVSVASIAFILAAAPLNHVIVGSIEMFIGMHTGQAGYGYAEWASVAVWAGLANMVGGLLFVTSLRFAQVGRDTILEERRRGR
ncbi:formate/nitrite transporter family protein [soil metagenome]